jgi:hypothetical protein
MAAGDEVNFKRHTFELSVAAGLDHQFIVGRKADPVLAQLFKEAERPFAGFCFGLSYIYRPIHFFGISAGFEYLQYGSRLWKDEIYNPSTSLYTVTAIDNGYGFSGNAGVPVYIHFYQPIKNYELEYITGPEFFFVLYTMGKYNIINYDSAGISGNVSGKQYLNSTEIRQSASLAWSMQVMLDIAVKKAFFISIGPEWKLLELKQWLPPSIYPVYHIATREVPYFLGIKVGFRLGYNFPGHTKKPVKG